MPIVIGLWTSSWQISQINGSRSDWEKSIVCFRRMRENRGCDSSRGSRSGRLVRQNYCIDHMDDTVASHDICCGDMGIIDHHLSLLSADS